MKASYRSDISDNLLIFFLLSPNRSFASVDMSADAKGVLGNYPKSGWNQLRAKQVVGNWAEAGGGGSGWVEVEEGWVVEVADLRGWGLMPSGLGEGSQQCRRRRQPRRRGGGGGGGGGEGRGKERKNGKERKGKKGRRRRRKRRRRYSIARNQEDRRALSCT
eukprot:756215-Hanusia_phi.AAC.11